MLPPKAPTEQSTLHPFGNWQQESGSCFPQTHLFIYLFIATSLALRKFYPSLISDTKEVAGSQGRRE